MSRVSVEIGDLVLWDEAGAALDPERFRMYVEAALQEMLLERGLEPGATSGPEARAPQHSFRLPAGAGERQLAQGIAQSVHRALGGGG